MSDAQHNLFVKILRGNNSQITRARTATFCLLQSPDPQSLQELLKRADGTIDRVSVYRSVALFEELGVIHRISTGWKYKLELTDQFTGHHHHLTCLKCGDVVDINDEEHIDSFIAELAQRYDFKPQRHQFEIEGYCRNCR